MSVKRGTNGVSAPPAPGSARDPTPQALPGITLMSQPTEFERRESIASSLNEAARFAKHSGDLEKAVVLYTEALRKQLINVKALRLEEPNLFAEHLNSGFLSFLKDVCEEPYGAELLREVGLLDVVDQV